MCNVTYKKTNHDLRNHKEFYAQMKFMGFLQQNDIPIYVSQELNFIDKIHCPFLMYAINELEYFVC